MLAAGTGKPGSHVHRTEKAPASRAADISMSDGLPDVVVDTKLETEVYPHCTIHFTHEHNPKFAGLRPERASEQWERQRELGSGGCGSVWLEKCVSGRKEGSLRAVKEIRCQSGTKPSSACVRVLEAIGKFSQTRVSPADLCLYSSLICVSTAIASSSPLVGTRLPTLSSFPWNISSLETFSNS